MAIFIFVVLGIIVIWPKLHASSDHFGWKHDASPDVNAVVSRVHSVTEKIGRNDKRYKTLVEFSDGFYFYSYATDRKDHLLSYSIGLSPATRQKIIEDAQKEHERELAKEKIKKDMSPDMDMVLGLLKFLIFCLCIGLFISNAY